MLRGTVRRVHPPRLDAHFAFDDGITAIFGPSGAGKTTLLHVLAGLTAPESGRIELGKRVLFDAASGVDLPPERRRVGIVFQEPRLFPHRTVRDNLRYGQKLAAGRTSSSGRTPPLERTSPAGRSALTLERVASVLELTSLLDRKPASLSGGEARRVAIGRVLLSDPDYLLLDEPLAGLDERRKDSVLALLGQVHAEFGHPMGLVSHSLADILRLTTRVLVLDGGRTLAQGELTEVLDAEEVVAVADSLGLESLLEVEILGPEGGLTRARLGSTELLLPPIDAAPGTPGLVALGPGEVLLSPEPVLGTSARNCVPGTVTRVAELPDRLLVSVDIGGVVRVQVSEGSGERLGLVPGRAIYCVIKAFSFRWRRLGDRKSTT